MKASTFSERLRIACDSDPSVPPYGHGRQVYLSQKMAVTQEAVSKWFTKGKPRLQKIRKLAKLLNVDEAWLALGIEPDVDRVKRKSFGDRTEGAVHALFGMATMSGGHCAFPRDTDPRADVIDFYVIVSGVQRAVHVCMGMEVGPGEYEFYVPHADDDLLCIGVMFLGRMTMRVFNLPAEELRERFPRKGTWHPVRAKRKGDTYVAGNTTFGKIESIRDFIA